MKKIALLCFVFLVSFSLIQAATIQGSIYNSQLSLETNVLIQVNTIPEQQFLSKDGHYQFNIVPGEYTLAARKGSTIVTETISIKDEGTFQLDVFLIPDLQDEEEIWNSTEENFNVEEENISQPIWPYIILTIIVLLSLGRFIYYRKKYGPLKLFRKRIQEESKKTIEQHKKDLVKDPSSIDQALDIIKKNEGRINQKDLRKEMAYLSEAKISLIVTELEHKGIVERVKKGRGNVILLKDQEAKEKEDQATENSQKIQKD